MDAEHIVREFVEAVNAHDVDRIGALTAEDFVFVGAYGDEVHGRKAMLEGWRGYFKWFPDYRIEIEEVMVSRDASERVALLGFAEGTYKGTLRRDGSGHWRLPAAWRAAVSDGGITLWQVYCDSKIPYDTMETADRERVADLK